MRKLLVGLYLLFLVGTAQAGAYEEILGAMEKNDSEAVVSLLKRGMDVNTTDPAGNTLLMIATRNGNLDLVKFLISNKAGVNRRNRFGDTASLLAALKGNLPALQLLHASGGQIEPGGWSALHYAVFGEDPEVMAWVIAQQPKLDARAPNGQTALMLAAKAGKLSLVKLLIDADADMDLADLEGATAISLARKAGHSEIAEYLRSVGAVE
jgi:ankyrin repeat protein